MIVISDVDAETRTWKDPLVDIHVGEFRQCAARLDRLQKRGSIQPKDVESLAEFLCEMSRDLIYRTNRVTSDQVRLIIDAFEAGVGRFQQPAIKPLLSDTALDYLGHIRARIDMLKGRLA